MSKICYAATNFNASSQALIAQANDIIAAYQAQGYVLTLRQLYYQFVSKDWLPNTQQNYKRLGSIVNDARLAGLIDWEAIEDRTRELSDQAHWQSPSDIIEACASQFRYDKWAVQPTRVEVWIEKEALAGVFERVCRRWDVPYLSCRGYGSQSVMWVSGRRIGGRERQPTIILHFGDHDPSGMDMSRDIVDRLKVFGVHVDFRRLALNRDQVDKYAPPPNPAKITDSRARAYIVEHGDESWELDALNPSVLSALVEDEIGTILDHELWAQEVEREQLARARLQAVADEWTED
jgi:hypothetical protein